MYLSTAKGRLICLPRILVHAPNISSVTSIFHSTNHLENHHLPHNQCETSFFHWRRTLTDRASGPGGLFKSTQKTINPWNQEQKALKLRLYKVRVDLENRRSSNYQQDKISKNDNNSNNNSSETECRFEDVSDITNFVEQQIEETMRKGGFDNLRNKGRPLPAGQPVSAMEFAMRIMRDNGLRPHWLQLMHDIDNETKSLRNMLISVLKKRRQREWEIAKAIAQVRIKQVNYMVDSFNLNRPMSFAHLFRLRLKIGDEIRRAVKEVGKQIELEKKSAVTCTTNTNTEMKNKENKISLDGEISNTPHIKKEEKRRESRWRKFISRIL